MLFVTPSAKELQVTKRILSLFGMASGLLANLEKCSFLPICCSEEDLHLAVHCLNCQVEDFPCTYLGLPLSVKRLRKVHFQSILDKVASKLLKWKGRLPTYAGRLILVRAFLCYTKFNMSSILFDLMIYIS